MPFPTLLFIGLNVYSMLYRPTLVLGLDAVRSLHQRLGSSLDIHTRADALLHTLTDLAATVAANHTHTTDSPVFDSHRARLVELAAGSPSTIIADFLHLAASVPLDAASPDLFQPLITKYSFAQH
jgi:hypothetical protein